MKRKVKSKNIEDRRPGSKKQERVQSFHGMQPPSNSPFKNAAVIAANRAQNNNADQSKNPFAKGMDQAAKIDKIVIQFRRDETDKIFNQSWKQMAVDNKGRLNAFSDKGPRLDKFEMKKRKGLLGH